MGQKRVDEPVLGRGLYSLAQVARYTGIHQARVRSWFLTRADRKIGPVFQSDFGKVAGRHIVSFLDMIDARVAAQLRTEGVSMPVIRAAYLTLRHDLRTEHPFSHRAIYTDGKRVFADASTKVEDQVLAEVVSRQLFFERVRRYLTQIDYSETSSLAYQWNVSTGIVINPSHCFGQPAVSGTGTASHVVYQSLLANRGNEGLVAELFGISAADVRNAATFEESLGRRNAA